MKKRWIERNFPVREERFVVYQIDHCSPDRAWWEDGGKEVEVDGRGF
jgi:hypothetical protein